MQQQINELVQNKTIDSETLRTQLGKCPNLINYQNKQTGDNLLLYASRFGNLNLIKFLHTNGLYKNMSFANNDGKNALHEVLTSPFM